MPTPAVLTPGERRLGTPRKLTDQGPQRAGGTAGHHLAPGETGQGEGPAGQLASAQTRRGRWAGGWLAYELRATGRHAQGKTGGKGETMSLTALIVLLLILALLGGLGFAAHVLWIVLVIAVLLWIVGFFVGGVEAGIGRRRWYGRW